MGGALAERLLAGGLRVVGYDVRQGCRDRLTGLGGDPAGSVREVFAASRVVVLSLPDSDAVAAVLGEAGDLAGSRVIDTTTGDPDGTAELGRRLADRGVEYLDATLTGSSELARRGELIVTA